MRKLLLSTISVLGLVVATPAFADCYCNRYGSDGACSDMICRDGYSTPYYNNTYDYNSSYYNGSRYNRSSTYRNSYYDPYYYNSSYGNTYYSPYGSSTYYNPYYYDNNSSYYYNSSSYRSYNDDVTVNITTNHSTVEEGDTLTYTIRVRNEDNRSQSVDVRAYLDHDVDFVSATDGGDESGDTVEWDNFYVSANSTETITLKVRVNDSASNTIELRVRAGGDEARVTTDVDGYGYNGDYYDDGNVHLLLSDSPDPVRSGDTLTYSIRIQNRTNSSQHIDVRAELDPDTDFLSASSGADENGDTVEWNNISLSRNSTKTLTLRVRVLSGARSGDTLRLRVESEDNSSTVTTRVSSGGSSYYNSYDDNGYYYNTGNSGLCSYYNSYLQEYYLDYCNSR